MFKNLSIKARLVGVLLFLCLQLIVGAILGLSNLSAANEAMRLVYDDRLVPLAQLDKVVRLLNMNELAIAKALTEDTSLAVRRMQGIEDNIRTVNSVWESYMATDHTADERKLALHFAEARKKYLSEALAPAVAAVHAQDTQLATELLHGRMETLFRPVRQGINDLIQLQEDVAKEQFAAHEKTYVWVRNTCIAALFIGLLLAAGIGMWLLRGIMDPLNQAITLAQGIAVGNLSQNFPDPAGNEMGKLLGELQKMNTSLVGIVAQVRSSTDTIATASTQIAAGNQNLSARTEEQASSLEETASSMEELTSTVKQNADNARQASTLAAAASEIADKGGAVVSDVVKTMEEINDSSHKIVNIIEVIDSIAFQTNILALNAAVEAARAGEQGRGFAVVASEVRVLAQRSASAAREIKSLIDDSVGKVVAGTKLVDQAGLTMQEILASVRRVSGIISEISSASTEQSAGIEQINMAISQMDEVTQQNASLVEEAAAASESMQHETYKLATTVEIFKVASC